MAETDDPRPILRRKTPDEVLAYLAANPAAVDVLLPGVAAAIEARALRAFADRVEEWYPPDVFIPPNTEQIAKTHALLTADGGTVDAWSAHIMRHATKCARDRADEIEATG